MYQVYANGGLLWEQAALRNIDVCFAAAVFGG